MTTSPSSKKKQAVAAALAAAVAVAAPLIWVARAQPPSSDAPRDTVAAEPARTPQPQPRDDRPRTRRDGQAPGWGGGPAPFGPGWGPRGADQRPPSAAEWSEVS